MNCFLVSNSSCVNWLARKGIWICLPRSLLDYVLNIQIAAFPYISIWLLLCAFGMAESWHRHQWAGSGFKLPSATKKAWSRTGKWLWDDKVNVCVYCSRMQPLTSCLGATTSSRQCFARTAGQGSFWGNPQVEHRLCKLLKHFWGPGWRYFALLFRKHTPKHHTIP